MNSEKQTLILAGEPAPQRTVVQSARRFAYVDAQRPLTVIATPVDDPMLLELTSPSRDLVTLAGRGRSYSAADAYARTQELAGGSARSAIIDTYA